LERKGDKGKRRRDVPGEGGHEHIGEVLSIAKRRREGSERGGGIKYEGKGNISVWKKGNSIPEEEGLREGNGQNRKKGDSPAASVTEQGKRQLKKRSALCEKASP